MSPRDPFTQRSPPVTGAPEVLPPDRFVTGEVVSPIVPWAPTQPAPLSPTYRATVEAYLVQEEEKVRAYQRAQ